MFAKRESSGRRRWAPNGRSWPALLIAAFAVTTSADAHHAFAAEFDADKPVEIRGVVKRAKWVNPHSWLYVDVKDADGTVKTWGFEFGTPNALDKAGLTKADLPPGTEVHIKGYLAKNGGPYGYSVILALKDGRKFLTGGAQDGPLTEEARR